MLTLVSMPGGAENDTLLSCVAAQAHVQWLCAHAAKIPMGSKSRKRTIVQSCQSRALDVGVGQHGSSSDALSFVAKTLRLSCLSTRGTRYALLSYVCACDSA